MKIFTNLLLITTTATITYLLYLFLHRKKQKNTLQLKIEQDLSLKTINNLKQDLTEKETELKRVAQAKTIAETRLEEAGKNIEEQKKLLREAHEKLSTEFKALSGESLKSNNEAFLDLAKKTIESVMQETKGDLGKNKEEIKGLVKPLAESLAKYEKQLSELENKRSTAYGSLENQLKTLTISQQQLQKETNNLVNALRRPEVRGRWGEITLKRVVELSGMSEHCDFSEQVSLNTDDGRIRPDMLVHLPSNRDIVIDSKIALDAYLEATEAKTEDERNTAMQRHAMQLRKHMKDLSGKNYWNQFEKTPEFVVMFIPGESFLSAALEKDPMLIEDGMKASVIISTPSTLIALLRAIAYGWRQEQLAENAQKIADLGKEIHDRFLPFMDHFNKTSNHLTLTIDSFNKMRQSLESRVMVSVRKFKELGVGGAKEIPEAKGVNQVPSSVTCNILNE